MIQNNIQITLKENERIAFCCDVHYDNHTPSSRIDNIQDTLTEKFDDILNSCIKYNVKHLFFEGDIINRIQISHESVNRLAKIFIKFHMKGIRLYTILGNHDIIRNSTDNIIRSPIDTFFTFGILTHINATNRVIINNDVCIYPYDYTETIEKADKNLYKTNILISHAFYNLNQFKDDIHCIMSDKMNTYGYDVAFLGHDHEEYPIVKDNNTYIIRSGSILRGTSHNYNFKRVPKFIVLNSLYNIKESDFIQVPIKHKPYKDIASTYVLNKKRLSTLEGLNNVLSDLTTKLTTSKSNTSDRVLDIINTDKDLPKACREILIKYINENA